MDLFYYYIKSLGKYVCYDPNYDKINAFPVGSDGKINYKEEEPLVLEALSDDIFVEICKTIPHAEEYVEKYVET